MSDDPVKRKARRLTIIVIAAIVVGNGILAAGVTWFFRSEGVW
jgi:hypothetical protein